jgi:RimJ/RimL family protein N-acetyltransferase
MLAMHPPASACLQQADALWQARKVPEALGVLQKALKAPWPLPERLPVAQRLAECLIKVGQAPQARQLLAQLQSALAAQAASSGQPVPPPEWCSTLAWCAHEAWWQPLQGPQVRLRRLQAPDTPWLKALFLDDGFADLVNRDYGQRVRAMPEATVAQLLAQQAQQSPVDAGALIYRVERLDGQALGLASLVTIDSEARRAEFIIGFPPGAATASQVMETGCLLIDLAFARVGFHKVTSAVYGDNPRLASLVSSLQALGFEREGLQRQHVKVPGGGFVDLHLMGALREDVLSNARVARLRARCLRQAG